MEALELIERISNGEDSFTQFKREAVPIKELAKEFVAFLNAEGGILIFGVDDKTGDIRGLSFSEIEKLGQEIGNCANENVKPPFHPIVENISVGENKLVIVHIPKGVSKPYATSSGDYYIKSSSDKKKISQEELRRLFAESKRLFADEEEIFGSDLNYIDIDKFKKFLKQDNPDVLEKIEKNDLSLEIVLENLELFKNGHLTLAGNLLFGTIPQKFNPSFFIDCCYFDGYDISVTKFVSKQTIKGTFEEIYQQSMRFVTSQIRYYQVEKDFNSNAKAEISEEILSEAILNALIHRDYHIQSSIKIFMFHDRVEIINPGKLYNSLTIEKIRNGIAIHRNPILSSICKSLLPYSGYGSGIRRILKIDSTVEFINDKELEQFKCIIKRRVDEI